MDEKDIKRNLYESEERYKSLFDGNYSVMLLIDPITGQIKDANAAACSFYGWSHQELCSMNISDINTLPPEVLVNEIQQAVKENRTQFLFKHRLANGEIRDVEVNSGPIKFNETTFHYSIVNDITKRRLAEDALRRSEENYRFMFANNPQPMWIVDIDTLFFLEVNNAAIQLYGYSREEFLSMTLKDIRPEKDIPALLVDLEQSKKVANSSNWVSEWLHRKKNGDLIFVEITAHTMLFDGKFTSHALINDISERKRAEEALRLQFDLQKLLMEISSAYISLPIDAMNASLNASLGDIAQYVSADRAYIFNYDFDKNVCTNTHEWCADGVEPQKESLQEVSLDGMSDWVVTHGGGSPLSVSDVFLLPEGDLRDVLEPQNIRSLLTVPMMNQGRCIGFVGFDWVKQQHYYSETELRLLQVFSQMLVNVWQRRWTEEALVESQAQLKNYAGHLQSIREEERVALAREIHDDLGQKVVALKIDVGLLKQNLIKENHGSCSEQVVLKLDSILKLIEGTITTTRRILSGLRPEMLEKMGFVDSVRNYLLEFKERYHVQTSFECKSDTINLSNSKSLALFRIVQEALHNVAKHAEASNVVISLQSDGCSLSLEINDDGKGFVLSKMGRNDSYGLIGMRERALLMDGDLAITTNVGVGTRVRITIPCN